MSEIKHNPEEEFGGENSDLVERVKQAQATAAAAAEAREQDVVRKLASIPELRAQQAEIAKQQEEVAQILQSFEAIRGQREFLPEEQQAYEVAQQAANLLANTMTELSRELDKPMGDATVAARMEYEASTENKKIDRQVELRKEYEQVKVDMAQLISEVDGKAQEFAELEKAKQNWNVAMQNLTEGLFGLVRQLDKDKEQKILDLIHPEFNERAYTRMADSWQKIISVIGHELAGISRLNVVKRRAWNGLRDYMQKPEHLTLISTKKPNPEAIRDELMARTILIKRRAFELNSTLGKGGADFPSLEAYRMLGDARLAAQAERKKYYEEHKLTGGYDTRRPADAKERLFDAMYEAREGKSR